MGRPLVIVRERVAEVTLELIDAEGLDAVSIERIAAELGVRGPSLYHHFADKAAILTEVARLVLGDLDLERPGDDWQQWMLDTSMTLYHRVLEHPKAAVILLQFLPDNSAVPGFGRAAQLLTDAGIDPAVQVLLMEGCEKIAWGWALQRAVASEHSNRLKPSAIPKRWRELAAAVRDSRWDDAGLVEASLRAFMNGVIDGHAAGTTSRPTRTRKAPRSGIRGAATSRRPTSGATR